MLHLKSLKMMTVLAMKCMALGEKLKATNSLSPALALFSWRCSMAQWRKRVKWFVHQTSFTAFEMMINYIYQVDIDCKVLTVDELFELVNLAERYNVAGLMEDFKNKWRSYRSIPFQLWFNWLQRLFSFPILNLFPLTFFLNAPSSSKRTSVFYSSTCSMFQLSHPFPSKY